MANVYQRFPVSQKPVPVLYMPELTVLAKSLPLGVTVLGVQTERLQPRQGSEPAQSLPPLREEAGFPLRLSGFRARHLEVTGGAKLGAGTPVGKVLPWRAGKRWQVGRLRVPLPTC